MEIVTGEVKAMTHQEDISMIEDTKSWLQSPERKAPKSEREYAIKRLDGVIGKIKKAMQSTLERIQTALLHPERRKEAAEQIKEKARPSILQMLRHNSEELRKKEDGKRKREENAKAEMDR